ncbi:hypothetical protein ACHAWO_013335 [Cyclotella atomus]|uniref:Transcription initiation factor TFIID subunit 12 domain-containing protein n=1 Tax=Cyclotella atomus TaxID=382360 RepID=A0ABD3PJY7_9STRA
MSSSQPPAPAPAPGSSGPRPSGSSAGKGKDFSRMSAPPTPASAATAPVALPSTTSESVNKEPSPGKKGKDLSRMVANAPMSTLPSLPKTASQDAPPSAKPPTPTSKPKGKDLSRMVGAPSGSPSAAAAAQAQAASTSMPPPVPTISQQSISLSQAQSLSAQVPESEQQRRQSIARAAAGLPDVLPKPIDIASQLAQTSAPAWSEASLSNVNKSQTSKAATQKKFGDASQAPLLGSKLQSICHSIDPSYTLDSKVQEMLLEMADGFIDKVTQDASKLAKHRGSNMLDVVDVALALRKGYGMEVPGLGSPSVPASGDDKNVIGGWLFSNKVNVVEKGGKKKKLRVK